MVLWGKEVLKNSGKRNAGTQAQGVSAAWTAGSFQPALMIGVYAPRGRIGHKEGEYMVLQDYPYLYETHMHTSAASRCARNTPKEMAEAAKRAGYTGIILTEHNWSGNTSIDTGLGWKRWVEAFTASYYETKAFGEQIGLDVFWGYEAGYHGTEFLIYGIEPEWLAAHPEMERASIQEQYQWIHAAGGMVIHAHPFREEDYIPRIRLFPEFVDGVEGINAAHSNPNHRINHYDPQYNERAVAYAREHKLPITAGSDSHEADLRGGGVAFPRRLHSVQDYCAAILNGEDYILTDGLHLYNKLGEVISD